LAAIAVNACDKAKDLIAAKAAPIHKNGACLLLATSSALPNGHMISFFIFIFSVLLHLQDAFDNESEVKPYLDSPENFYRRFQ